eukprot:746932-Pyramimonas_sp.AAC.1
MRLWLSCFGRRWFVYVDGVHYHHKSSEGAGITQHALTYWKDAFAGACAVTRIGKNSSSLCFSCPRGWQNIMFNLFMLRAPVQFCAPCLVDARARIDEVSGHLSHAGVQIKKMGRHEFGSCTGWPKHFKLSLKMRPLGSHFSHRCKSLFCPGCRALNFAIKIVRGSTFGVNSAAAIARGRGLAAASLSPFIAPRGTSTICFGNAPRDFAISALSWALRSFKDIVGPRISCVQIPWSTKPPPSRSTRVFCRAFHHRVRNQAKGADLVPRLHNFRNTFAQYYVIHVDDIEAVARLGWTPGLLFFGSALVGFSNGRTHGNPLGPGVCACSRALLPGAPVGCSTPYVPAWRCFASSPVSGRSACVCVCFSFKATDNVDHHAVVETIVNSIVNIYTPHCSMKVENDNIFVGVQASVRDNHAVRIWPRSINVFAGGLHLERPRFRRWFSNQWNNIKFPVIQSQIMHYIDRFVDSDWDVERILNLIMEFWSVGSPLPVCSHALMCAISKHPYISDLGTAMPAVSGRAHQLCIGCRSDE